MFPGASTSSPSTPNLTPANSHSSSSSVWQKSGESAPRVRSQDSMERDVEVAPENPMPRRRAEVDLLLASKLRAKSDVEAEIKEAQKRVWDLRKIQFQSQQGVNAARDHAEAYVRVPQILQKMESMGQDALSRYLVIPTEVNKILPCFNQYEFDLLSRVFVGEDEALEDLCLSAPSAHLRFKIALCLGRYLFLDMEKHIQEKALSFILENCFDIGEQFTGWAGFLVPLEKKFHSALSNEQHERIWQALESKLFMIQTFPGIKEKLIGIALSFISLRDYKVKALNLCNRLFNHNGFLVPLKLHCLKYLENAFHDRVNAGDYAFKLQLLGLLNALVNSPTVVPELKPKVIPFFNALWHAVVNDVKVALQFSSEPFSNLCTLWLRSALKSGDKVFLDSNVPHEAPVLMSKAGVVSAAAMWSCMTFCWTELSQGQGEFSAPAKSDLDILLKGLVELSCLFVEAQEDDEIVVWWVNAILQYSADDRLFIVEFYNASKSLILNPIWSKHASLDDQKKLIEAQFALLKELDECIRISDLKFSNEQRVLGQLLKAIKRIKNGRNRKKLD